MDPEPVGQGQGHRRRPRPGADHGVGDAAPDPLVDQGRGEGGLYAHLRRAPPRRTARHRSTPGPAARVHADGAPVGPRGRRAVAGPHPGRRRPPGPRRVGRGAGRPARRPPPWCGRPSPRRSGRRRAICSATRSVPGWPCTWPREPIWTIRRLVLIGGTGGIEDPGARRRRRQADEATAAALEASGDVDGVHRSVAQGAAVRPTGRRGPDAPNGGATPPPGWRRACGWPGPALRCRCGTDIPELSVPLLALAGSDDTRFAVHALRLARLAPRGYATLIPGGGHAVHLARPDLVGRHLRHWLATA